MMTRDSSAKNAGAALFARVALAAAFLSAVADRFGVWGAPGVGVVAWGEFGRFVQYVHQLAPYLSGPLLNVAAWVATAAELLLGTALLLGIALRWSAYASAGLLVVFALSMALFVGIEAPLGFSVFSAAAASLLLALAPPGADVLSVDRLLRGRRVIGFGGSL
jgi:uncharacterized membrane protein YphA (DoxX/SURF4 family)